MDSKLAVGRAVAQNENGSIEFDPERMVIGRPYWLTWRGHLAYLVRHATHIALYPAEGEDARHVAPVENGEPATSAEILAQPRAKRRREISTRRVEDGVVHEMADLGTGTMCERDLREPWEWTYEAVNCEPCLARMKLAADAKEADRAR